jgi:hypothetical protein
MKWYGTDLQANRKIHSDPDCRSLQTGRLHPVVVLDDADFTLRISSLCKTCCRTAHSLHVRCQTCGHRRTRPCPHNGGVLVYGATGAPVWVWPEDALSRTLVHPMQKV